MVPSPFQPPQFQNSAGMFGREEWCNEWDMKHSQPQMVSQQSNSFSPWIAASSGWQGELGPNLMPQEAMQQNMPNFLPSPNVEAMQQSMPTMLTSSNVNFVQEFPGMAQNSMDLGLQNTYVGQDVHMQNLNWDVQSSQFQPVHTMNNGQGQMMQVITLPAGAPPPQGAIPMGPIHGADQEAAPPQMMQMIELPVGQAPPEGAIPMDQFSSASTAASTPTPSESGSPSRRSTRGFKIKDPRTGREVSGHGEETGAPRRMRIVNPKTGMEVRPGL